MSGSEAVRRALRERVARKVAGSGISPRAIERAVDAVVAALPPDSGSQPGTGGAEIIVALSARSIPDLGSRIRAALSREGISIHDAAIATAGQHTVMTLRAPVSAKDAIARVATAQKASFTVVDSAMAVTAGSV